jgi:hypothetical protein
VVDVIPLSQETREYIQNNEEEANQGVLRTLMKRHVVCFVHDSLFRLPEEAIVHHLPNGTVVFPAIRFPEIPDPGNLSGSPGERVHRYLMRLFPYLSQNDELATVVVGWGDM